MPVFFLSKANKLPMFSAISFPNCTFVFILENLLSISCYIGATTPNWDENITILAISSFKFYPVTSQEVILWTFCGEGRMGRIHCANVKTFPITSFLPGCKFHLDFWTWFLLKWKLGQEKQNWLKMKISQVWWFSHFDLLRRRNCKLKGKDLLCEFQNFSNHIFFAWM